jgi:hypothetical protein
MRHGTFIAMRNTIGNIAKARRARHFTPRSLLVPLRAVFTGLLANWSTTGAIEIRFLNANRRNRSEFSVVF